jgi:hypothetical protein
MQSQTAANSVLIGFHPVLLSHTFSRKYPDLPGAGNRYVKVAGKINRRTLEGLVAIARQLFLQERQRPSFSSAQLQGRVQSAVSSAVRAGTLLQSLNAGGNSALMAAIIILMLVQDGDQDLKEQMLEAQAQLAAKQAVRSLLNYLSMVDTAQQTGGLYSVGYVAAVTRVLPRFKP